MSGELTVTDVAGLCGLDRNKVGYWVRSGKLHARRSGKKYLIPHEELLFFLKSSGLKVPDPLTHDGTTGPVFRMFQNCWEYWQGNVKQEECNSCVAFRNHWSVCFTTRESDPTKCLKVCHECAYYLETYVPRIGFIHQFDCAAAVYKDLVLWGVNREFSGLFQNDERDFIGMGIERVLHPDSLESLIRLEKRGALGDHSVPMRFPAHLKSGSRGKVEAFLSVYPLHEPKATYCLTFEMTRGWVPSE
jgi:excisionase family DNA binding protein